MAINIKDVRFSYGSKEVLKGVDAHIKKGKFTGILGPNGCGKTTLLKNVLGTLKRSSGTISLLGVDEHTLTQREKATKVSLVPQKSSLMSPMSVEDFVVMGRLPHLKNTWSGYSKNDYDISRDIMKKLDLDRFDKRVALSLSGGEFQRVLLARALTQEPEILLLDEPTSAMDLNHAVELMECVSELISEGDITAVAVLHDLNLASLFCDELIIMKDGVVMHSGTPSEVITKEILKEVYGLNAKVIEDDMGNPYVIPLTKIDKR